MVIDQILLAGHDPTMSSLQNKQLLCAYLMKKRQNDDGRNLFTSIPLRFLQSQRENEKLSLCDTPVA